jgi:hypothetical protein
MAFFANLVPDVELNGNAEINFLGFYTGATSILQDEDGTRTGSDLARQVRQLSSFFLSMFSPM